MKKLITQLFKFGIVGIIATVIDLGVLILLTEVFSVDVLISSAAAFTVSVTFNYFLSMLFVFKSSGKSKVTEFLLFILLSIGGLLINQLIMWAGTSFISVHYLFAKVFSEVIVTLYNFVTRKLLLEKK